ncbi:MAG: bacillithiol biosynthesis deacetylase BshB1 [Phycisphaerae bacterium]|nr:bacillithiol biosynthesis deacetylase BshB1 [Phycisphaerae bacterium]
MAELLVFAPHPDDAELGMGGTIAKLTAKGVEVAVVDMTNGEPTPYGSPEIRAAETARATEALGLPAGRRVRLDLVNRQVAHDLASRHKIAAVIRRFRPRWLFAPVLPDAHPDHVAATRIIEDARFDAKLTQTDIPGEPCYPERILYYYCSHIRLHGQPRFVVDVSEVYERKMKALDAYQSQFYVNRGDERGAVPESIRNRDRYFGDRVGVAYAEPFTCHELIGLSDLSSLI